ncbi:hypothetical protein BGX34_007493 [Mortierella sp. NVP85]|nr:hypothetical protein BGX34_007493 [Mortierella sp. NVP85]
MPTETPADTLPAPADTHDGKANHPLAQILVLYHKATSTFLLRQLASAYSTSLEALELLSKTNLQYGLDHSEDISTRRSFFILKQKLWVLHTTVFGAMLSDRAAAVAAGDSHHSSVGGIVNGVRKRISGSSKDSPEKLVKEMWRRLVDDYGGLEGDVDGQVMVPFVFLCVNQKLYMLARQIVEAYLATIPDGMLIHLETAAGVALNHGVHGEKDPLITNYERLVELYVIHVLAKLNEWDYAAELLQYNNVLSDQTKKAYGKILDRLHQKSLRPKKTVSTKHVDDRHSGPKSLLHSTSTTALPSPTLSSTSTLDSSNNSHPLDSKSDGAVDVTPAAVSKKSLSSLPGSLSPGQPNDARTKLAVTKKNTAGTSSISSLQNNILAFVRHYVDLIRNAQLGSNHLMVIVGVVVFIAAVARNRARASRYWKAGMAKMMETVKMGTTVTSI